MAPRARHNPMDFYPRSPCGERHRLRKNRQREIIFLSTLYLRRATIVGGAGNNAIRISIHALLAESDYGFCEGGVSFEKFLSTLSLRRATAIRRAVLSYYQEFLSTLSLRRATVISENQYRQTSYFYPRSPCGERLASVA